MAEYRYNGVKLPELPVVLNQTLYPCALIVRSRESGVFYLMCTCEPVHSSEGTQIVTVGWAPNENRGHGFRCNAGEKMWVLDTDLDNMMYRDSAYLMVSDDRFEFIWTNTTISSSLGSVFLQESVPVPVFDLRSWLTGFVMGMAGMPMPVNIGRGEENG